MKNQKKKQARKPVRKSRRTMISIAVACVVVLAAAITVISRQVAKSNVSRAVETKTANNVASSRYRTVKVAGHDVQIDQETGQLKPLSPQEAQKIAESLKGMLNKSTEGLVEVKNPDGSVSMDLQGRFQNVTLARTNADGTIETECTDEPGQAAQFFGIDPKLVGVESKGGSNQVTTRTPAKKVSK